MPKFKFALAEDGPKELEVETWLFLRKAVVRFRGETVVEVPSKEALLRGASGRLPDESEISIRWTSGVFAGLELLRNGVPVPGSSTDPAQRIRVARNIFAFIGTVTSLMGLALLATDFAGAIGTLLEGALFLGAAFGTHRQSKPVLIAGTALLALDTLIAVVDRLSIGGPAMAGGLVGALVMRTFFFVVLARAIRAFDALRPVDAAAQARVFE